MKRPPLVLAGLGVAALVGLVALAFSVGSFPVAPADVLAIIIAKLSGGTHTAPPNAEAVVLQIRGPRVFAALLIGAALAVSGTAFQSVFRNPLVAPDILGVSAPRGFNPGGDGYFYAKDLSIG